MPIIGLAPVARTFDQQCSNCGQVNSAVPFANLVIANPGAGPGNSSIGFTCPNCGALEFWNTNLGPEDESNEWRGLQARRIRALMLLLALARRNVAVRG